MGASISKYVFRVREPTYLDDDGSMLYIQKTVGEKGGAIGNTPLLWLHTRKDQDIPATILRCKSGQPRYTILLSHGNMEDLGIATSDASAYVEELQCDIMLYEYTGYGQSSGKPSESNCYADILAAYDHLVLDEGVDPEKIILFGRSMGSGPTVFLAAHKRVGGVILVAPILSCARVVQNLKVTPPFDLFPNVDRIGNVHAEILIVHGKKDRTVPVDHGMELVGKALYATKPLWIEEAGHNNIETDYQVQFLDRLKIYLDDLLPPPIFDYDDLIDDSALISRAASRLHGYGDSLRGSWRESRTSISSRRNLSFGDIETASATSRTDVDWVKTMQASHRSDRLRDPQTSKSERGKELGTTSIKSVNSLRRNRTPSKVWDRAERRAAELEQLNASPVSRKNNSSTRSLFGSKRKITVEDYTCRPSSNESSKISEVSRSLSEQKVDNMRDCMSKEDNSNYSDEYLERFLRARKFNVEGALDLIYNFSQLGQALGINLHAEVDMLRVRRTLARGIMCMTGAVDTKGAPVLFVRPANYVPGDTPFGDVVVTFIFFANLIAKYDNLARKGVCVMVDMSGCKDKAAMEVFKQILSFIQSCYPVEIRAFHMVDSPMLMVRQWLVTRSLVKKDLQRAFHPRTSRRDVYKHVGRDLLPDFMGGSLDSKDSIRLLRHVNQVFSFCAV